MRILVATPYTATHYDAGLYWAKALTTLGHSIYLWDYRIQPEIPKVQADASIVFKGETIDPSLLPRPSLCYWPDALERTPGIEKVLRKYDKVATPVRPTPEDMAWVPSGFDPAIHKNLNQERKVDCLYIGTANSAYKINTVSAIAPDIVCGNEWQNKPIRSLVAPPVYLHDFTRVANSAKILVDIHQSPHIGVNRKVFEMMACGFTIIDSVPGIDEIFPDRDFIFSSAEEAIDLIAHFLKWEKDREETWKEQRSVVEHFTYERCAKRLLKLLS